jgi:hypothetical protein
MLINAFQSFTNGNIITCTAAPIINDKIEPNPEIHFVRIVDGVIVEIEDGIISINIIPTIKSEIVILQALSANSVLTS